MRIMCSLICDFYVVQECLEIFVIVLRFNMSRSGEYVNIISDLPFVCRLLRTYNYLV